MKKLHIIKEWILCLINPNRKTDLRIDPEEEERLFRKYDLIISALFGALFITIIFCIWQYFYFYHNKTVITGDNYILITEKDFNN